MRALTVFPVLGAALIALTILPAEARNGMSHGGAVSRHVGIATPGRFVIVSNPNTGRRILAFDRSLGRFVAFDRMAFTRRSRSFGFPFGFVDGFDGADGFIGFGGPTIADMAPGMVLSGSEPAAGAPQSRPLRPTADLPPCREVTSVGVVIERGMNCSNVPR
jgi:hypothetical protein